MKEIMTVSEYYYAFRENESTKPFDDIDRAVIEAIESYYTDFAKAYAIYVLESMTDDEIEHEEYNHYNGVYAYKRELLKRIKQKIHE